MINYDEFQRDVRRRKRERWAKILATEPPGRAAGRRPRDPEQERMLLRLDRARLDKKRSELHSRGAELGALAPSGHHDPA